MTHVSHSQASSAPAPEPEYGDGGEERAGSRLSVSGTGEQQQGDVEDNDDGGYQENQYTACDTSLGAIADSLATLRTVANIWRDIAVAHRTGTNAAELDALPATTVYSLGILVERMRAEVRAGAGVDVGEGEGEEEGNSRRCWCWGSWRRFWGGGRRGLRAFLVVGEGASRVCLLAGME